MLSDVEKHLFAAIVVVAAVVAAGVAVVVVSKHCDLLTSCHDMRPYFVEHGNVESISVLTCQHGWKR